MRDVFELLVQELKPFKKSIFFCSFLAFFAAGLDTAAPILMGRAFDFAGKHAALFIVGGMLLASFVARFVAEIVRSHVAYRGSIIAVDVGEGYTRRGLVKLLNKPLSFHYGKKSQEISEKFLDMNSLLDNFINAVVFDFLPAILAIIGILSYLTIIDWRIAGVLCISIMVLTLYTYRASIHVLEHQREWWKARRKVSSAVWDALRNVLVVKSTANESLVENLVKKYAEETLESRENRSRFDRRVRDMQNFFIALGSLCAISIAVFDFRSGVFTLGRLTTVTAYAFSMFGYVRFWQWQVRSYLLLTAAYTDVKVILAEPVEDFFSGIAKIFHGAVEFRNVRFRYREDKPALEDINFVVRAGMRVAIVGESGEGKTTMVDLLERYYEPQSGSILIDGTDAKEINLRSLRSQMAYVPQDLTLFHESIGFNIRYGRPTATDEEVHIAARLAHLDTFIDSLPEKYNTVVGERGMKLSGGERQRVALARAFLRDPRILILDEPTAHLDSKTEEFVRQALETLMAGRTTFIIAHRLRTVIDADTILVLKDGRIVESGRHEALLQKPDGAYAALLKAQGGLSSIDETAST